MDSEINDWVRNKQLSLRNKKLKIKYIQKKCNRSEGRNLAAKNALHENLVFLDAGCTPEKDWLEKIKAAITKRGAEIIAGNYQSKKHNFQEYLISRFLNTAITDDNFIYPSARNFAIKKSIFEKVHGFNEKLNFAEDLDFFTRAAKARFKIEKCEESVVWWKLPKIREYFRKIFNYAKGDAESGIWWDKRKKLQTHNVRHLLTIARYVVLFVLTVYSIRTRSILFSLITIELFGVYLAISSVRKHVNFRKFSGENGLFVIDNIFTFVYIKLVTDLMTIGGFSAGLFHCFIVSLL